MIVQYLAIIILIIVTLFAYLDFKKCVLAWMPMQLLFNNQIALRYESPGVAMVVGVNVMLLFLYYIKEERAGIKKRYNSQSFVLKPYFIASIIVYGFSMLLSIAPITKGLSTTIKFFVCDLGLLFLFQKVLCSKTDIRYFFRCCLVVVTLTVLLGLYEVIFKDNPWLDFVYMNSPHDDSTHGRMFYIPPFISGGLASRYNMIRAYSFYGLHISFGTCCLYFLFLISVVYVNKWKKLYDVKTLFPFMMLAGIGVFLANSKTAMVGLLVMFFALFDNKNLFKFKIIAPVIFGLIALFVFFPDYVNNYLSLVDTNIAEEGGGSTVALRTRQYEVAIDMWAQSPILGNGPGSIEMMKNASVKFGDILGAESIWLRILPERGIIGAFVYLSMYYFLYANLKNYIPKRQLFIYLSTLLVVETAASGANMSVACGFLIAVKRMYQLYGDKATQKEKLQKIMYENR